MVLAIEVAKQRGSGMAFVPGLAFAVILITNALLVLASFRARRAAPAAATGLAAEPSADVPLAVDSTHPRRRWVLNAVMLVLLAVGGVVLWYGNHSQQLQPSGVVQWIRAHLHRGN